MSTKLEKTIAALISKFEAVNWYSIEITLKKCNRTLVITPISYGDEITSADNVDLFCVYYSDFDDTSSTTIKKLAQNLIDYNEQFIALETGKSQLFKFYETNINIANPTVSDLTHYSDDHKSFFGFRPDKTFGQPRI